MEDKVENQIDDKIKLKFIKENLTYYMLKENYIDNPDIFLGYPIIQKKAEYGNNKIELYPILNYLLMKILLPKLNKLIIIIMYLEVSLMVKIKILQWKQLIMNILIIAFLFMW